MRILSSSIDKKLKNIYVPKFISNGNTLSDSKKIFRRLLRLAKKESRLEGTSHLPKNYGNFLLKQSLSKDKTKNIIEELRNRVNAYIEKRSKTDPEEYKKEIEKSTTFNALIRQEIRKGNI